MSRSLLFIFLLVYCAFELYWRFLVWPASHLMKMCKQGEEIEIYGRWVIFFTILRWKHSNSTISPEITWGVKPILFREEE